MVGIGTWTGVHGAQRFLVFQTTNANGQHERWATNVAATVPFDRDEPVVVVGFRPKPGARAADLLPFGAVPMLTPIASARRLLLTTEIRKADGTVVRTPFAGP